jgi:hypothetical protein
MIYSFPDLLLITCLRLFGWCYSEPSESVFEVVEGLDKHAPVHCDAFAEPPWVKDWLCKNVREPRCRGHTAISESRDGVCHKLPVIEPFHGRRISCKFTSVEENLFNLVSYNILKHFPKGPLRLLEREIPRCFYMKKPWFSMRF